MVANYINQTSRTILFEEFNRASDIPQLDILLGNSENPSIRHKKVKDALTVTSFDEFMDKFKPKYYECQGWQMDELGNRVPLTFYSLDKKDISNAKEYEIRNQPFFNAMMKLYHDKGDSGKDDFTFSYDDLLQRLYDPKAARDRVDDLCNKLTYNVTQYQKLEAINGSQSERQMYAQKIIDLRKYIQKEYTSTNQFNMLPLYITEVQRVLNNKVSCSDNPENASLTENVIGEFYLSETGKPEIIPIEEKNNDVIEIDSSAQIPVKDRIINMLSLDFDEAEKNGKNALVIAEHPESTQVMKKLHLSLFAGADNIFKDQSRAELENLRDQYELWYRASQESFAREVASLVEKVIGVKSFFDHAGDSAELIVANCNIERLMNADNQSEFKNFIRAEGQEQSDEKIWLSIIPAVYHKEFVIGENGRYNNIGIDASLSGYEKAQESFHNLVSFETFQSTLNLLCQNKIITFFNFKGCKKTSSISLNKDEIKKYKRELNFTIEKEDLEYAVFCYPNFTILPEGQNSFSYKNDNDSSISNYINLPATYLDSAYVACGLTVLSQNKEILRQKGFQVKENLCCPVRFDYEGKFDTVYGDKKVALSHIFPTRLNREAILSWDKGLLDEVRKDGGFGFCFCGDEKWYDYHKQPRRQEHAYVFRARTLAMKDGRYRPIYKTYVKTYINTLTQKISVEQMNIIFTEYALAERSKIYINNLLYSPNYSGVNEEETIEMKEQQDNGKREISISYSKDLDDFNVEFSESES